MCQEILFLIYRKNQEVYVYNKKNLESKNFGKEIKCRHKNQDLKIFVWKNFVSSKNWYDN